MSPRRSATNYKNPVRTRPQLAAAYFPNAEFSGKLQALHGSHTSECISNSHHNFLLKTFLHGIF